MKKSMRLNEVLTLGSYLNGTEDLLEGVKLNAKSIYNVLKLKKATMEKFVTAQETLVALAKTHGATSDEEGTLKVPPENLTEFNEDYAELMQEKVEIEYNPIEISGSIDCPIKFMEAFFDFILITD